MFRWSGRHLTSTSGGGFFYFIYLIKEQIIPMVDIKEIIKELIALVVLVSFLLGPFIIDYIEKVIERWKKK